MGEQLPWWIFTKKKKERGGRAREIFLDGSQTITNKKMLTPENVEKPVYRMTLLAMTWGVIMISKKEQEEQGHSFGIVVSNVVSPVSWTRRRSCVPKCGCPINESFIILLSHSAFFSLSFSFHYHFCLRRPTVPFSRPPCPTVKSLLLAFRTLKSGWCVPFTDDRAHSSCYESNGMHFTDVFPGLYYLHVCVVISLLDLTRFFLFPGSDLIPRKINRFNYSNPGRCKPVRTVKSLPAGK